MVQSNVITINVASAAKATLTVTPSVADAGQAYTLTLAGTSFLPNTGISLSGRSSGFFANIPAVPMSDANGNWSASFAVPGGGYVDAIIASIVPPGQAVFKANDGVNVAYATFTENPALG